MNTCVINGPNIKLIAISKIKYVTPQADVSGSFQLASIRTKTGFRVAAICGTRCSVNDLRNNMQLLFIATRCGEPSRSK